MDRVDDTPDAVARRAAILELVRDAAIATQAELARMLAGKGIVVTQATVSRDVAALGLVKASGRYAPPEPNAPPAQFGRLIREKIRGASRAGDNLLVVKTNAGEAGALGLALDRAGWSSIVGTVAGDDTVFVACDGRGQVDDVLRRLGLARPPAGGSRRSRAVLRKGKGRVR